MTTVKVLVAQEVLERLFTRDHLGNRLRVEWGEVGPDGFHDPVISVDYTDNLVRAALTSLRDKVAGLKGELGRFEGGEWFETPWINRNSVLTEIDRALGER